VLSSAWKREAQAVVFDIEADGFLYNMVRSIVGTLVEVGRGKMPLAALREAFTSRDRRRTGPTAPACGLCLMEVRY
jgi:tRNA pseudouridine38-40 synthase